MTYVMADIHGNQPRFDRIMKMINLCPEDTLYILGDVIDRFPDGIPILRRIMKMPNVKMLLGNHEYMMLKALYIPDENQSLSCKQENERQEQLNCWYRNGGRLTHDHLKRIRKELRDDIFEYLNSLPLNINIEVNGRKYLLVHGGIEETFDKRFSEYNDPVENAVWSRESMYAMVPQGKTLIFGHTPTNNFQSDYPMRIWKCMDRIGIDCGCGYDIGQLACLRLDDMKEFYSGVSAQ